MFMARTAVGEKRVWLHRTWLIGFQGYIRACIAKQKLVPRSLIDALSGCCCIML